MEGWKCIQLWAYLPVNFFLAMPNTKHYKLLLNGWHEQCHSINKIIKNNYKECNMVKIRFEKKNFKNWESLKNKVTWITIEFRMIILK